MEVNFLSSGCGDGIHFRFLGNDEKYYNVLIDGGIEKGNIYQLTLKKAVEGIIARKEIINLWIITHIDDDHIGGILRFIKDVELNKNVSLSETLVWYNYSVWDYDTGIKNSNLKSVHQGIRLRDYLHANAIVHDCITDATGTVNFHGTEFTFLSPNQEKFEALVSKWKKEEVKLRKKLYIEKKKAEANDYGKKIEEFDLSEFKEDDGEENGSSIAFLLSFNGKKGLFLADSHPSQIVTKLKNLGYSKENPVPVDFVKISHHGSKYNTCNELLELINCTHFIISADGYKHNLPNKETLVRILKNSEARPITFYFTHKNESTVKIFKVDKEIPGLRIVFPDAEMNGITLNL